MKLLISESGKKIDWNGDVKTLQSGVYYLMKRIETIRVVGSASVRNTSIGESARNTSISESPDSNVNTEEETVDESAGTLTKPVNNDRVAGKIHYWKGERYCRDSEGRLERFPASDEPQKVNGELFSGSHAAGVFKWDRTKPEFAVEKTAPNTTTTTTTIAASTEKKKNSGPTIEEMEQMLDNLDGKGKKKPKAIAEAPEEDAVFDDAAFLDDIADPVNEPEPKPVKDSCTLSDLTLIVFFENVKYQKRFKTEKVATSQLDVFRSMLIEDRAMAKELLNGSMSTFTKA